VTLAERLAQLPDTALVPVAWVRELLSAENGAQRDDLAQVRPGTPSAASTDGSPALLTAREVAHRLGCSTRYVYTQAGSWPFTVRLGRAVRFDAAGLQRWIGRAP
jgi:excisionase family DNA binding protein